MTFDDWSNIVTANAYWMHLVLVMVILVVFYRQYREIHIRKECELLARIEIEKIKKELVKEIKAKNKLEMEVKRFRLIFKGLPLVVNNVITESDIEAFHFYILLKNTSTIILNCSVEEWKKTFLFFGYDLGSILFAFNICISTAWTERITFMLFDSFEVLQSEDCNFTRY